MMLLEGSEHKLLFGLQIELYPAPMTSVEYCRMPNALPLRLQATRYEGQDQTPHIHATVHDLVV
jgi:hypothetical protein